MLILIHGPAELIRAEALADIASRVSPDPELASLNTVRLDGRAIGPGELENAADPLPFLAERRLVIVEGLLRRLAGSGRRAVTPGEPAGDDPPVEAPQGQVKGFVAYLDRSPDSTDLVFLEEDTAAGGPVLRRLRDLAAAGKAAIILAEKPRKPDLPDWIRARARLRGVRLDPSAVADLAEFVGDELRQLDQELIKLGTFAGGRTVSSSDVRRLVPATRQASVFEFADALGSRNAQAAGRLMVHTLDVDGEQPLRLLGMIARQYRLLIQAKTLQARGVSQVEMSRLLNVQDWTTPRLLSQAGRHSLAQLEAAMERILAADESIKTGKMGDREAMDLLLAELLR